MRLEDYIPPEGLSTPLVTILDSRGRVLEEDQRALVRYVIQAGRDGGMHGANVLFAAGTTGEWNLLDNPRRQFAATVVVDECRRSGKGAVEAWMGITAPTRKETLENLVHALEINADAAVVAPLSIADAGDPADFVEREIGGLFERKGRKLPVFLYDNADIAAPGKAPHMHTRDVKRMSRLDYVFGVKVTASAKVLANYTRAASHFNTAGAFAIYTGNGHLIFDLFAPAGGIAGWMRHGFIAYRAGGALPAGIVAGPSNVTPREWRRAWQVSKARDRVLMERYAEVLNAYRKAWEFGSYRPAIACLKAALKQRGIVSSDAVAPGAPRLDDAQRHELAERMTRVDRLAAELLEPQWLSKYGPPEPAAPEQILLQNG